MRSIHPFVTAPGYRGIVVTAARRGLAMPNIPGALKAATSAAGIDPPRLPQGDGMRNATATALRNGDVSSDIIPRKKPVPFAMLHDSPPSTSMKTYPSMPLLQAMTAMPALIGLLLLSACGGAGSDAAPTPTPVPTPAPAPTPIPPPVTAVDPTRLPVGDGKISTTQALTGYVYACSVPTSPNPPGKAPWISADGLSWDSTAKTTVRGAVLWVSSFSANFANGVLSLTGNGLPDHATGTFPIAPSDPAYPFDKNPNTIQAVAVAWGLPANPVVAARPSCTDLGAVGILLSGARLYNALDADGRDAAAHELQDACGGHPQGQGIYHYHDVSKCLAQTDQPGNHSPLVGYIADGFGIYGNLGEGGKPLTNADLDACHGHTHALLVNGVSVTQYHYHATKEYPYTIGCYAGTPTRIR